MIIVKIVDNSGLERVGNLELEFPEGVLVTGSTEIRIFDKAGALLGCVADGQWVYWYSRSETLLAPTRARSKKGV